MKDIMSQNTYDAFFVSTLTTMILGFSGLALRYCLKSKCEHCTFCWGCLKIDRRVELEDTEIIPNDSGDLNVL